jgi:mycothiol synthase
MRRPLPGQGGETLPPAETPAGVVVRTFEPGRDEEAFLALNAEAFAGHPEQGRMSRTDLDQRMAEPWFDPGGFFLAEACEGGGSGAGGDLLGFHWTKVHPGEPPHGEVYVVGVSPRAQGMGLGRLLTLTGLHHLAGLGLAEVVLYVESDNAPAIAVYSRLGFAHAGPDTHVMYRRHPPR